MALTISGLETILVARNRGLIRMSGVSEDPDADSSPRTYLAGPIGYAVRKSSGTTASFAAPSDADLSTVADADADQLIDLADLRLQDDCLGNWTEPDQSEGPLNQKFGGLAKFYLDRAECLRKKIQEVYKVDADIPTVGDDGGPGFSGSSSSSSIAYL